MELVSMHISSVTLMRTMFDVDANFKIICKLYAIVRTWEGDVRETILLLLLLLQFLCGLFDNALSIETTIVELKTIWKELVVT
jgi:hypothetical protein